MLNVITDERKYFSHLFDPIFHFILIVLWTSKQTTFTILIAFYIERKLAPRSNSHTFFGSRFFSVPVDDRNVPSQNGGERQNENKVKLKPSQGPMGSSAIFSYVEVQTCIEQELDLAIC